MRLKFRAVALIAVTAAAAALMGCTPAGDGTSEEHSTPAPAGVTLPEKNLNLWTMPFDQYMVTQGQIEREAFLHALISQSCLTKQGFAHSVPAPDMEATTPSTAFTEMNASQQGYRVRVAPSPADEAWGAYTTRVMSDAELAALDQCVRDLMADPEVPKWDPSTLDYAAGIAQAAVLGALEDPIVKEAAQRWADCMVPLGISDLPASPSDMPSPSMIARYGWDGAGATSVTGGEIADAVEDAACREESGYSEALYEAEWVRQRDLLNANVDALEQLRKDIAETDALMIEQVAELAPSV